MSLMSTVTKLAVGFAVAKGLQKVQQAGGFNKVLDNFKTQMGAAGGGGGLTDMLGGLTGGGGAAAGGLGGIGGLLGGLAASRTGQASTANSLESLLSQNNPAQEPPEEETAGLMIRAMIMAARSDGQIDDAEKQNLMTTIGEDASQEDMAFVQKAMSDPVDVRALADETPTGMETQVYSMSVMAITPDTRNEANYLNDLANALGLSHETVNEIHDSFQVQRLYT